MARLQILELPAGAGDDRPPFMLVIDPRVAAGTVESVSLIEDRETGRSRGFGFVEMQSKEEGAKAVAQFNGKEVGGRALKVNEAKPRENRNGGFGGSRY